VRPAAVTEYEHPPWNEQVKPDEEADTTRAFELI
jgi:hypothetical protein